MFFAPSFPLNIFDAKKQYDYNFFDWLAGWLVISHLHVLILGVENAIFEIQEHEKEKKKGKEKITIPERNSNRYFYHMYVII